GASRHVRPVQRLQGLRLQPDADSLCRQRLCRHHEGQCRLLRPEQVHERARSELSAEPRQASALQTAARKLPRTHADPRAMPASTTDDNILTIAGLTKSFGAIQALRGVDFELRRGEIHAIAGENGAGKSTLMNIVDGILRPDSGKIYLDGNEVRIASPAMAQRLGIGFVHQEIALCPDVSVAENIFMGVTASSPALLMDYRAIERRAAEIRSQLGDIDPVALVGTLSISQQQLVEIAKALTLDCRVLILDEPTAALTEREAQT